MIFVVIIVVIVVVAAVVFKRMSVGMGVGEKQPDSVFELLEDRPSAKNRAMLIGMMHWEREAPLPDRTSGCYVILTYPSKKAARSDPDGYTTALIGHSSKSAAALAAKHLAGAGNEQVAEEVVQHKKPFTVALLDCEDYGMDLDECETALRKVFNDERLQKKAARKK